MLKSLPFMMLAFVLAAMAGAAAPPLRLVAKDSGTTTTLHPGDRFTVALRENSTTGYSWTVVASGEPVIKQVGEKKFVPDSKLHGAGGAATYAFEAVALGTAELKLAYARPWEKDAEPAEKFTVTVSVK